MNSSLEFVIKLGDQRYTIEVARQMYEALGKELKTYEDLTKDKVPPLMEVTHD